MTNPPNYSELMNELWKASEGGTAAWWPRLLGWCPIKQTWVYSLKWNTINDRDAYFIAKGHAEEFLQHKTNVERRCTFDATYSAPPLVPQVPDPHNKGCVITLAHIVFNSLPAALAYAQQQQGATNETN